jgi:hypothetical protein
LAECVDRPPENADNHAVRRTERFVSVRERRAGGNRGPAFPNVAQRVRIGLFTIGLH